MKARIEFDMPEQCVDCVCCETGYEKYGEIFNYCFATNKKLDQIYSFKPDWCPLEPIPKESILKTLDDIDEIIRIGE
jgi:hypothetical protein